jgi:hypothetical protein
MQGSMDRPSWHKFYKAKLIQKLHPSNKFLFIFGSSDLRKYPCPKGRGKLLKTSHGLGANIFSIIYQNPWIFMNNLFRIWPLDWVFPEFGARTLGAGP